MGPGGPLLPWRPKLRCLLLKKHNTTQRKATNCLLNKKSRLQALGKVLGRAAESNRPPVCGNGEPGRAGSFISRDRRSGWDVHRQGCVIKSHPSVRLGREASPRERGGASRVPVSSSAHSRRTARSRRRGRTGRRGRLRWAQLGAGTGCSLQISPRAARPQGSLGCGPPHGTQGCEAGVQAPHCTDGNTGFGVLSPWPPFLPNHTHSPALLWGGGE